MKGGVKFAIEIRIDAHNLVDVWRLARTAEQLLRERAPAGVSISLLRPMTNRGSKEFQAKLREAGRLPASEAPRLPATRTGRPAPARVHPPARDFDAERKHPW